MRARSDGDILPRRRGRVLEIPCIDYPAVPRKIYLESLAKTLVAFVESRGEQRGYPQCRHSIRKTTSSTRLGGGPIGRSPAYSTIWNRLDLALRGPRLRGAGRGKPAVAVDPLTDAVVILSVDDLLAQFPPRPSSIRSMQDEPPDMRPYVHFAACFARNPPRRPLNVVVCNGGCDYRDMARTTCEPSERSVG